MKKRLNNLLQIDFVRHNLIFLTGTLAISVLNYIYYPVLSRLVSVVEFGEIQAAISIFMQLGILLTAFGYVVTNITGNKNTEDSKQSIIFLERVTLLCSVVLFLVIILFSNQLSSSFQFSSVIPLLLVGVLIILNVPSTSRSFVLQGLKRLREVSISGIIFSLGKLILTVLFILGGLSVEGAILGYIIAQVIALIYLEGRSSRFFPNVRYSFSKLPQVVDKKQIKVELKYGLVVLILLTGVALLYSFDVVIARLFLTPEEAGGYSGISSVARIIYFATASIAGVLIASVNNGDSYERSRKVLLGSIGILMVIGLTILLIFCLFPVQSIAILLGSSYVHLAHLLPITGVFMLVASVNNLLITFQISRRKYTAIFSVVGGLAAVTILLLINHSHAMDLIVAYLISNAVVFVILIVQIVRRGKDEQAITISSTPKL